MICTLIEYIVDWDKAIIAIPASHPNDKTRSLYKTRGCTWSSKEGLFFRWAMTLYLILSGEALWLGGAWDAPTEGDGSCTSGN